MKDTEQAAIRKYRIFSMIKESVRGFYLILLVSAVCILALIAIMLLL